VGAVLLVTVETSVHMTIGASVTTHRQGVVTTTLSNLGRATSDLGGAFLGCFGAEVSHLFPFKKFGEGTTETLTRRWGGCRGPGLYAHTVTPWGGTQYGHPVGSYTLYIMMIIRLVRCNTLCYQAVRQPC
jgi:hypothetical protein